MPIWGWPQDELKDWEKEPGLFSSANHAKVQDIDGIILCQGTLFIPPEDCKLSVITKVVNGALEDNGKTSAKDKARRASTEASRWAPPLCQPAEQGQSLKPFSNKSDADPERQRPWMTGPRKK